MCACSNLTLVPLESSFAVPDTLCSSFITNVQEIRLSLQYIIYNNVHVQVNLPWHRVIECSWYITWDSKLSSYHAFAEHKIHACWIISSRLYLLFYWLPQDPVLTLNSVLWLWLASVSVVAAETMWVCLTVETMAWREYTQWYRV